MRHITKGLWVLGALVVMGALAGCSGPAEQPTAPPAGTETPGAPATPAGALGAEHAAGPFQVTLDTDPDAPKAGDTKLEVKVTKDGQPVKDASVNVSLSMPSMKMMGPEVTLKPRPKGARGEYEGTANLNMGGEWEAKTTVTADGDTGAAVYRFSVNQ